MSGVAPVDVTEARNATGCRVAGPRQLMRIDAHNPTSCCRLARADRNSRGKVCHAVWYADWAAERPPETWFLAHTLRRLLHGGQLARLVFYPNWSCVIFPFLPQLPRGRLVIRENVVSG